MEQQPQYFDVNGGAPETAQPPFWRSPKFLAGIGLFLLALLLAIFLVNFFTQGGMGLSGEQESSLAQRLAACADEEDAAACEERVRAEAAKASGSAEACKGLTEEEYASCAALAAWQSGSTSACKKLKGDEKTHCEDLAFSTSATSTLSLSSCEEIVDAQLAAGCTASVIAEAVATGSCEEAGVDAAMCDAASVLRAAIAAGTEEACDALLTDDAKTDCENGIASLDADADGLAIRDEVINGTSDGESDTDGDGLSDGDEVHTHKSDPKNTDTDGDGYNDGDEVKNGFSPVS